MTETANYRKLVGQQRYYVVPANIHIALTGARQAAQDQSGDITLTYVDDTTETRNCGHDVSNFDSWMHLVGWVQAGRPIDSNRSI